MRVLGMRMLFAIVFDRKPVLVHPISASYFRFTERLNLARLLYLVLCNHDEEAAFWSNTHAGVMAGLMRCNGRVIDDAAKHILSAAVDPAIQISAAAEAAEAFPLDEHGVKRAFQCKRIVKDLVIARFVLHSRLYYT